MKKIENKDLLGRNSSTPMSTSKKKWDVFAKFPFKTLLYKLCSLIKKQLLKLKEWWKSHTFNQYFLGFDMCSVSTYSSLLKNIGVFLIAWGLYVFLCYKWANLCECQKQWFISEYSFIKELANNVFFATGGAIILLLCVCRVCYRRMKDKLLSWRYIVCPTIINLLICDTEIVFKLYGDTLSQSCIIAINILTYVAVGACAVFDISKSFRLFVEKKDLYLGFTKDDDSYNPQKIDSARKKYIDTLIDKLINTPVDDTAFGVAITGRWGSGKSYFVNGLKCELENRGYQYIVFDPWQIDSARGIVEDFFDKMCNELHIRDTRMEHTILRYSKVLQERTDSKGYLWAGVLSTYLSHKEQNSELMSQISAYLKMLSKPIFVLIDNMDRMDENEMYEVLKLVRDTANFSNIVYIVTMDKNYVTTQLRDKLKEDASLYLEKIFPVELPLPMMDEVVLSRALADELRDMCYGVKEINSVIDSLTDEERTIIGNTLKSYRGMKHFARQFILTYTVVRDVEDKSSMNIHDLFFLELLRYHDFTIYDKLSRIPESMLAIHQRADNLSYYAFVEDSNNIQDLSVESKKILMTLFPNRRRKENGICLLNLYSEYFCMGTSANLVSASQFDDMLSMSIDKEEVKERQLYQEMRNWLTKNIRKRSDSIAYRFNTFPFSTKTNFDELSHLWMAYVYWLEFEEDDKVVASFEIISRQDKYLAKIRQPLHDLILSEFSLMLKRQRNWVMVAKTLSSLYNKASHCRYILSESDIVNLLIQNAQSCLQSRCWDAINLVRPGKENSGLYAVAQYSMLVRLDGHDTKYYNPVIPTMITYLSQEKHQGNLPKLMEAKRLLKLLAGGRDSSPTVETQDEFLSNEEIGKIFGTENCGRLLKEYFDKCFVERISQEVCDSKARKSRRKKDNANS